jgi:glycosyltransferase involved in cell wall biosynthesis
MQGDRCNPIAVIPVHNEAATIGTIVARAVTYLPVLVVNDASDDGSGQLAAAAGATVLTLPRRQGKGAALRQGFTTALRCGADAVVTLDGDGQHDPGDIPRLLAASQRWPDSIIIGSRLTTAAEMPRHRLQAIRVASFWISWMCGGNIADTQSGFRVYPASVLYALRLKQGGFLLESELLLKASRVGWDIREVPIHAVYHSGKKSHYRPIRDGVVAAMYLLYHGLRFWPSHLHWLYNAWQTAPEKLREQVWHRTWVAALATGLLPVLCLVLMAQLLLGRVGLDVLAPVIRSFYDQRLLQAPVAERNSLHDHQQSRWECV